MTRMLKDDDDADEKETLCVQSLFVVGNKKIKMYVCIRRVFVSFYYYEKDVSMQTIGAGTASFVGFEAIAAA